MEKSTKLIIAALGLGGLGYFLYKKGLFNQSGSDLTLNAIDKDINTAVEPEDSAVIEAAKAKEFADAELAKLQDESAKMKLAIEAEKARLAKLLADANAEAAVREAATAEAQRVRLAQIEAERVAALESESVRVGRIEAQRLEDARIELIAKVAAREAEIAEAARIEAEKVSSYSPIYVYPTQEIINQIVDTSDEPEVISTGKNKYAEDDQLNMELNQMLYR